MDVTIAMLILVTSLRPRVEPHVNTVAPENMLLSRPTPVSLAHLPLTLWEGSHLARNARQAPTQTQAVQRYAFPAAPVKFPTIMNFPA